MCRNGEVYIQRGAHTNQSCRLNSNNNKNPIPKGCKGWCYLCEEQHRWQKTKQQEERKGEKEKWVNQGTNDAKHTVSE